MDRVERERVGWPGPPCRGQCPTALPTCLVSRPRPRLQVRLQQQFEEEQRLLREKEERARTENEQRKQGARRAACRWCPPVLAPFAACHAEAELKRQRQREAQEQQDRQETQVWARPTPWRASRTLFNTQIGYGAC